MGNVNAQGLPPLGPGGTIVGMKPAAIIAILTAALGVCIAPGCNVIKLPEAPVPITTPEATVDRVELVDRSETAARYLIVLTLNNPNDFALPMTDTQYELAIAGAAAEPYDGDTIPNATLPASGSIQIKLPAVVRGAGEGQYDLSGSIRVFPPGQLKKVGYELGIPRPRVAFAAKGDVTPNIGGEVIDIPVIEGADAVEGETITPTDRRADDEDERQDEAPETPGVGIE